MHMRMMPTMLVQMLINGKMIGLYRALCDTGSEAELVHHDTIAQWYHQTRSAQVSIVGLGEQDVPVTKKIEVQLRPWYAQDDTTTLTVTLWVLPKSHTWGPTYPERQMPCEAIREPLEGPLADPLFWQPSKVHLLLGIEVLAMLMMGGCTRRVGNRLITQQTAMGNVIFGKAGDWVYPDSPQLHVKPRIHVVNMQDLDKSI